MSENATTIIVGIVLSVMLIMITGIITVKQVEYSEQAKRLGCTYIGTARDLPSVAFLDCNGEVKLKLKSELKEKSK